MKYEEATLYRTYHMFVLEARRLQKEAEQEVCYTYMIRPIRFEVP